MLKWLCIKLREFFDYIPTMLWNGEYPVTLFKPFDQEGSGASLGLVPMTSFSQQALNGEYPLTSILALRPRREWGKSRIGSDEVIVPPCFGVDRKVYKYHPRLVTSLHIHGCVLSANICFRKQRDHGKTTKLLGFVTLLTTRLHSESRYSPTC